MAALQATGSVLLPVVVQPARRANAIVAMEPDGTWKVAVAAPAREGEANAELCSFIRDSIPLRPLQVAVHRGHRSRQKLLLLTHHSAG